MPSRRDSLATAVESAKEQDLRPLAEECARELDLDSEQVAMIESGLEEAWFYGIRTGHAMMIELKGSQADPGPVVLQMRQEFQDLMESLADALDATVGVTISAWDYLGRAWIGGARFWNVEIAARLIESTTGGFDEALRRLRE